ncbi:PD-(D/E)XK nuclease family protein [Aneurinibacillus thermoaerophilus]|uniref:RecB family exonuclease n=1 Tax=Aneurinibacillus thermoaerophilus TaxID=143495 RepID=UPI002E21EA5D|nr:PD-(D/E)XK nuclease family protein [Aneurinibacillus thermoaerophilus]
MPVKLPRGYLSVSQIRTYQRCPKQYEYQYVYGMKTTFGSSFLLGRAFHKAIEEANRAKMETGEIFETDQVADVFSDAWETEKEEVEWKEDEDKGQLKDSGLKMTMAYYEEHGRTLSPFLIETGFMMEVEGIPFQGFIDLAETDGTIRDFKTASKSPTADVVDSSIQLAAYALAYRELTGQKEVKVGLDYVVNLKKGPKITRLETEIDKGRMERLKATIQGVGQAISAGVFYPNEEGFACGYCSFRELCKGK